MQNLQYNPEVTLLLINQSEKTVNVLYNNNPAPFQMPKIGPRPPYYAHPSYQQYYPVI